MPSRLQNQFRNTAGFTLLELVMVIALIGIMSFVAIPKVIDTRTITMQGATTKLLGDIRYAQNLATTTGDTYGFRTTGSANTGYEIYKVSTNDAVESPYDHNPMQEDFTESYSGTTFDASHDIWFDSNGLPSIRTGTSSIVLNNEAGDSSTITVNNAGLVTIE